MPGLFLLNSPFNSAKFPLYHYRLHFLYHYCPQRCWWPDVVLPTDRPPPPPPQLHPLLTHLVHLSHTPPGTLPAPQVLPELPGIHPYATIPTFTREESSLSQLVPTRSQFQLLKSYCCPRKLTPGIRWIKCLSPSKTKAVL